MILPYEEITKLLFAVMVGGLIGAEREYRQRTAGLRTIIFICLGSTVFTMLSLELGGQASPVRIAAHMVTGVGFLCAGVIKEEKSQIVSLTTASTIWFTAALGMGIGGGQFLLVLLALAGALIILWIFPRFGAWLHMVRERRTYEMICSIDGERMTELETLFQNCGLRIQGRKLTKQDGQMVCTIEAEGSIECHDRATKELLNKTEAEAFSY